MYGCNVESIAFYSLVFECVDCLPILVFISNDIMNSFRLLCVNEYFHLSWVTKSVMAGWMVILCLVFYLKSKTKKKG